MNKIYHLLPTLLAILLLPACTENLPMEQDPTSDNDFFICISAQPMVGEEVPYNDTRIYTPMTSDRENMIRTLLITQYDEEGNLRRMHNGERYLFKNFVNQQHPNGVPRVTDHNWPELVQLRNDEVMKSVFIANVEEERARQEIFPHGIDGAPLSWEEFKDLSIDLPFTTNEDVEKNPGYERGQLMRVTMFGFYEGALPEYGFTIGLGRMVTRIKVFLSTNTPQFVTNDLVFFYGLYNIEKAVNFIVPDDTPHHHSNFGPYEIDASSIDLRSNGGFFNFYVAPHHGSVVDVNAATSLRLWVKRGTWNSEQNKYVATPPDFDEVADYRNPQANKGIDIPFGNNPAGDDYTINRNTIYSYNVALTLPPVDFNKYFTVKTDNSDPRFAATAFDSETGLATVQVDGAALLGRNGGYTPDHPVANGINFRDFFDNLDTDVTFSVAPANEQPNEEAKSKAEMLARSLSPDGTFSFYEVPYTNFKALAADGGFAIKINSRATSATFIVKVDDELERSGINWSHIWKGKGYMKVKYAAGGYSCFREGMANKVDGFKLFNDCYNASGARQTTVGDYAVEYVSGDFDFLKNYKNYCLTFPGSTYDEAIIRWENDAERGGMLKLGPKGEDFQFTAQNGERTKGLVWFDREIQGVINWNQNQGQWWWGTPYTTQKLLDIEKLTPARFSSMGLDFDNGYFVSNATYDALYDYARFHIGAYYAYAYGVKPLWNTSTADHMLEIQFDATPVP